MTSHAKGIKKAGVIETTQMTGEGLPCPPRCVSGASKGIMVGRNWKVGADSLNIVLYYRQVSKKIGRESWKAYGYYATATNALLELVNQGVRDTKLADLKTVCDKIDQLRNDILGLHIENKTKETPGDQSGASQIKRR